jgi:hypothetical protein
MTVINFGAVVQRVLWKYSTAVLARKWPKRSITVLYGTCTVLVLTALHVHAGAGGADQNVNDEALARCTAPQQQYGTTLLYYCSAWSGAEQA